MSINRMPNKALYRAIAKLIASGDCVLFVGSGISKGEKGEKGLPGAEQLAVDLWEEIKDYKVPLNKRERKDLVSVANWFKVIKNKSALNSFVKERFLKVKEPLRFHRLISKLPFNIIITTNYDLLLEKQFDADRMEYVSVVKDNDLNHWNEQKIMLLKIHGCIERSEDLIISEDDYVNYLSTPSPLHDVLKYLFCTKSLLFIGYSLSDINIKVILRVVENELKEREKQHYLIYRSEIDAKIIIDFAQKGIEMVKSDGLKFVERLTEEFNGLNYEERIGTKFDFYLSNYRLDALKFFEAKILKMFVEDIDDGTALKDDYRFQTQLLETFQKTDNQEYLIKTIKRKVNDSVPIEAVLNIISQIDINDISDDIIIQLNDLLVGTDNETIKYLVLNYLFDVNRLKDDILPILKNWTGKYERDSDIGKLLFEL